MENVRPPLRAIALLTSDKPVRCALLKVLGETEDFALQALAGSAWSRAYAKGPQQVALSLMVIKQVVSRGSAQNYWLRVIALMTVDCFTREALLQILGETPQQALAELVDSDWLDCMGADPGARRHALIQAMDLEEEAG